MSVLDIHTHHPADADAVISREVDDFAPRPWLLYSVGVHPWHSAEADSSVLARLNAAVRHPQVVAVGETGLDTLRGAALQQQEELLAHHIALADDVGKPLIVHCVRAWQPLVRLWRATGPHRVGLAVHGFRGNERVAATLLDAGFVLSYGPLYNPMALAATPLHRLLLETDEADMAIGTVVEHVAATLGLSPTLLASRVRDNAARFLDCGGH